jgi:cobalt-precorrin 5A hydrolase
VDDRALFSICVLSGHVGRGNFYTNEVARVLGNTPVITTASDVSGTLTVDILGRELGWRLESMDRNVTRGCAAVVNETRVAFVQECGEPNWWPLDRDLPKGVEYYRSLEEVAPQDYEILLIASDRSDLRSSHPGHYENSVIYHPKSLTLGMGCDRDTSVEVLERGMKKVLNEFGLSIASVKGVASVDAKSNEAGLLELARRYGWEFKTYLAETLDGVIGIENPSEIPKHYVGTRSVSEAAALLYSREGLNQSGSDASRLVVSKQKYREEGGKSMTIAVARIDYPRRIQKWVSSI